MYSRISKTANNQHNSFDLPQRMTFAWNAAVMAATFWKPLGHININSDLEASEKAINNSKKLIEETKVGLDESDRLLSKFNGKS